MHNIYDVNLFQMAFLVLRHRIYIWTVRHVECKTSLVYILTCTINLIVWRDLIFYSVLVKLRLFSIQMYTIVSMLREGHLALRNFVGTASNSENSMEIRMRIRLNPAFMSMNILDLLLFLLYVHAGKI